MVVVIVMKVEHIYPLILTRHIKGPNKNKNKHKNSIDNIEIGEPSPFES
jgi:hypothetical protein